MWYGFAADAMVIAHCAYVGYVVLGQLAIWLGWLFGRRWVRHFWFRITHLLAIGFVAFEEAIAMDCPLTIWEGRLRELAGQDVRAGTFMGRLFHDVLFLPLPAQYFTWMHVGFAVLVVGTFVFCPPRWPAWLTRRPPEPRAA